VNRLTQTATPVADAETRQAQQLEELSQENSFMLAISLGAQLLAFSALYLLPAAANAGWWAALLQLIPLAGLGLLGRALRRALPPEAERKMLCRGMYGLFALLFFSDMAVCLLSLTELAHVFFFPKGSRLALALSAALALGLGIPDSRVAVPHTARALRWVFAAALIFCAVTVMPSGEAGYLFPLAGYGVRHTLRCAALASGSVWAAGAAVLLLPSGTGRPLRRLTAPAVGVGLVAGMLLCCAYVLPGTELSSRWGYALRLQLLMEMSPNTLSWSLMLIAEMLLFLTGFAASADFFRRSAGYALGLKRMPLLPAALLCLPLALRGMGESEALLLRVLPLRGAVCGTALGLGLAYSLWIKRRRKGA